MFHTIYIIDFVNIITFSFLAPSSVNRFTANFSMNINVYEFVEISKNKVQGIRLVSKVSRLYYIQKIASSDI